MQSYSRTWLALIVGPADWWPPSRICRTHRPPPTAHHSLPTSHSSPPHEWWRKMSGKTSCSPEWRAYIYQVQTNMKFDYQNKRVGFQLECFPRLWLIGAAYAVAACPFQSVRPATCPPPIHRPGKLIMLWLPLLTLSSGKCAAFLTIFPSTLMEFGDKCNKDRKREAFVDEGSVRPGKDTVASLINDRRLPGKEREDLHPIHPLARKTSSESHFKSKETKKIIICRPRINQGLGERGWEGAWPTATVINVYEQPLSQVGWIPMA